VTDPTTSGERSRWYLATTRNNAVGMLAVGLVMPAVGFTKYYQDVLSLAPGRIVLTSSGARPDWFSVTEEAADDIPVLIELLVELAGDEFQHAGSTIAAVAGVVPISRLVALHFATQQQADEFLARRYDNVDPASSVVHVSPELFEAEVPALAVLQAWLATLPSVDHPTAEDIRASDTLAGAVLMALACPAITSAELNARRSVLERLLDGTRPGPIEDAISEALGIDEWLSAQVRADRGLLSSAVKVLAGLSPTTRLGTRRVLTDIRALVDESRGEIGGIEANLARVESILKAEAELGPLTEGSGLRSAKALLLFLLRPSPDETSSWSDDMPGDPFAVLGACVLSGLTAGARLLPTGVKRGDLYLLVVNVEADRINADSPHTVERFAPPDSTTLELSQGGDGYESLLLGGTEVVRTAAVAAGAADRRSFQDPLLLSDTAPQKYSGDEQPADVANLLDLLRRADLTDPRIARVCAAVCKRLEWTELVETIVEFGDSGFRLEGRRSVFPGVPPITPRIDRDGFLERIASLNQITGAELDALHRAVRPR
jgi:hypothetical protein